MKTIIFIFSFIFIVSMSFGEERKLLITQIACVDIPRVLEEVNNNIDMQIYLLKLEDRYQEEAREIESKIEELYDYINDSDNPPSRDRIEEVKQEIEYQKLLLKEILVTKNQEVTTEEIILKGIYRLIKEVAEREGYSMIIEKTSSVLYNKIEVDVTEMVLSIMRPKNEIEEFEE